MEPLISLTLPVLSGSRSRTRAAVTPFHHVLQGLTTFREDFLKHDPDNRLFIETAADGTYKRSTIIFGPVARLSRINSTGQYDLDGTYFKAQKHKKDRPTRLPGFIKGIVYSDANNCYHPLAIQHDCIEESEDGYRQLLEHLWREFPHTVSAENGYGSDRDTGLMSYVQKRIAEGLSTPKFVHCTAHIKRNVISRYRGREKVSIRNKAVRSFDLIAYGKRQDQVLHRLSKLQSSNQDLYDYFMKIGPEFFCESLMTEARPEKLTSNSVESLWSITREIRTETRLPLFFQKMYNFTINKVYKTERIVENYGKIFSPYASAHIDQRAEWAVAKGIKVIRSSSNMLTGSTADSKGRISSINLTTMACTCQAKQTHRLPCACQIFFLIQTRTYDTRLTQCVHHCFHTSSWREALRAAINHPSSFGPCSSTSSPAFHQIIPLQWMFPTQPVVESFLFPTNFGPARGRPLAAVQNRQLDVRPWRGQKQDLFEKFARIASEVPPSYEIADSESSEDPEDPEESSDESDQNESEREESDNQSQDNYPTTSGDCPGCGYETTNVHGCIECRRPTHLHCGGKTIGEEGYSQKVICRHCVANSSKRKRRSPSQVQKQAQQQQPQTTTVNLVNLTLRDPPSAREKNANRHLVQLSVEGDYKWVSFSCVKCGNQTACVKYLKFTRWDVYGFCVACRAKYKKTQCRTNFRTGTTTLCLQLNTDDSFVIPEAISTLSSDDEIHPHFQHPKRSSSKRQRSAERALEKERAPSQGDPYDSRNALMYA